MDEQETDESVLRRLLWLFAAFVAVCLLAGASRMRPPAWQLAALGGDVLRVREALSILVFAPAVMTLFWMLCRCVGRGRASFAADALLVLTVYYVACGMGIHDPANRLEAAYGAGALGAEVRRSLAFLDDGLGHWVFWSGFVLGTWVLGVRQLESPLRAPMGLRWRAGLGAVASALLWVMLTNLWDEYPKTRADLCVIAGAVAVPLAAHAAWRRGVSLWRLPVLVVIYPAYVGSVAGTLACWLARYGNV